MRPKLKTNREATDSPCMQSIFGIGLSGILSGLQQVVDASQRLSRAFSADSTDDPVKSMVDLQQGARQVEASAKIIEAGKKLDDSVLDIVA